MIYLYGFAPLWGLVDLSPFVTKVDCYLRLAQIPYKLIPFSMESFSAANESEPAPEPLGGLSAGHRDCRFGRPETGVRAFAVTPLLSRCSQPL